MTLQQVKDEALHFSQRERAELAHLLLVSLDNPTDGGLEAEWDREVARRAAEVEAGSAIGRPAFAALDEIRASRT